MKFPTVNCFTIFLIVSYGITKINAQTTTWSNGTLLESYWDIFRDYFGIPIIPEEKLDETIGSIVSFLGGMILSMAATSVVRPKLFKMREIKRE